MDSSQTKKDKHESSFKFSELIIFSNSITCQLMTVKETLRHIM
jgi:hypothetical protein